MQNKWLLLPLFRHISFFFSCWLSKSRFSALSVTAIKKDNIHIYRSCCPKYLVCNASGLFIQTATLSTFDQALGAKNRLKFQMNFYAIKVVPPVTLPPITLFSQLHYFELGPKKILKQKSLLDHVCTVNVLSAESTDECLRTKSKDN